MRRWSSLIRKINRVICFICQLNQILLLLTFIAFPCLSSKHSNIRFEILIVDDNSPDGTAEVFVKLQRLYAEENLVRGSLSGCLLVCIPNPSLDVSCSVCVVFICECATLIRTPPNTTVCTPYSYYRMLLIL